MRLVDGIAGELSVSRDDEITAEVLRNIIDVVELEAFHVKAIHPGRGRRARNADTHRVTWRMSTQYCCLLCAVAAICGIRSSFEDWAPVAGQQQLAMCPP